MDQIPRFSSCFSSAQGRIPSLDQNSSNHGSLLFEALVLNALIQSSPAGSLEVFFRMQITGLHPQRWGASQVVLEVKNPPANAGDTRDAGSIPGSGRSPGVKNGNPLQCSCLEIFMSRGAWQATVVGAAELDTTEQLSMTNILRDRFNKSGVKLGYLHFKYFR